MFFMGICVDSVLHRYCADPRTLFRKRTHVLPQHFVKSRSREIRVYIFSINLIFDRHLGTSAAKGPVKLQSDMIIITPQSCGKTSVRLLNRGLDGCFASPLLPWVRVHRETICSLLCWERLGKIRVLFAALISIYLDWNMMGCNKLYTS